MVITRSDHNLGQSCLPVTIQAYGLSVQRIQIAIEYIKRFNVVNEIPHSSALSTSVTFIDT